MEERITKWWKGPAVEPQESLPVVAEPVSPLGEEKRQLTLARIRRAAVEVVCEQGFDASIDEIAKRSGVSVRTVYRHYRTHEGLLLATVKDMFAGWGQEPPVGIPRPTEDLEGWLRGTAIAIHTAHTEIPGEAFWDIFAPPRNSSPIRDQIANLRTEARTRSVRHLTSVAWHAAGGNGDAPETLYLAFALNLSSFTTRALITDFDRTPEQIGVLTSDILLPLIRGAVDAQRDNHGEGVTNP